MTAPGQTGFHQLPLDIIGDILRSVQGSCASKSLLCCWLVCKDWRDAIKQSPVRAESTAEQGKLWSYSQMLPKMASMAIVCRADIYLNLTLLRDCRQLTSLSLSARRDTDRGRAELTIINIPTTLKEVTLNNLFLPPNSLTEVSTSVTKLQYQLDAHNIARQGKTKGHPFARQWEWIQDLQNLQDLQLTGVTSRGLERMFGHTIERTSRLQSLANPQPACTEDRGRIINLFPNLSELRSISMSNTTLPKEWLELAFQFLPNLTSLTCNECKYSGGEADLTAETRVFKLKSLTMRQSNITFLDLAGKSLQSLEFEPIYPERGSYEDSMASWKADFGKAFRKIGSLSRLTRLELYKVKPHIHDIGPLHGLQLQELALHHCSGLELDMFKLGALPLLSRLHIRESRKQRQAAQDEDMQKLAECGKVILSLPYLVELSGSCCIFSFGIADELSSWQSSDYTKGLKSSFERNVFVQTYGLKVWRRP